MNDSPAGLTDAEAAARLARDGPNELAREAPPSWPKMLARQYRGALVALLVVACVLSLVLGEIRDAIAIAVILVVNGLVGFAEEWRAESALGALRAMSAPKARVEREGRVLEVRAREVAIGDVLVLEAGDVVAADAHVILAHELSADEAALTGESTPSEKAALPASDAQTPLAERHDRVHMGTSIAAGAGRARVDAIGMSTELGKIARLLAQVVRDATPLETRLEKVGRTLALACLGIVALVALVGFARRQAPLEIVMAATSLAVAAVPEGLATIVTMALAIGVTRMAARRVLVRRLPSVETLGCASVVCTDKTGTLTTGVMQVREIDASDEARLLDAAIACCDADVGTGTGDATELAIERAGQPRGILRVAIERDRPRVAVQPFDSTRKRMSMRREDGVLYVKGALESILTVATSVPDGLVARSEAMAARGLRVLAVAVGTGAEERDLEVLGVIGLADPPRPEAIGAVAAARAAGVRVVMITGDHEKTARAIAREMGILRDGDDPAALVYARATPEDKLRVVRAAKERGDVVAMTGDGVNDAPALREAHIGIAMGRTGTEVTREAADMVLADDNFASIVEAIREGRGVFDNIRRALVYLLAGNVAELAIMLVASIAGMPLPLTAVQLLWINLVTDGLPALALVAEPAGPDVLEQPPRAIDESVLRRAEWIQIALVGALHTIVTLGSFAWALSAARPLDVARSIGFSVLVASEVFFVVAARSFRRTFFEVGPLSNVRVLGVLLGSLALQAAVIGITPLRDALGLGALSWSDVLPIVLLGLVTTSAVEITKLVSGRVRAGSRPPRA